MISGSFPTQLSQSKHIFSLVPDEEKSGSAVLADSLGEKVQRYLPLI